MPRCEKWQKDVPQHVVEARDLQKYYTRKICTKFTSYPNNVDNFVEKRGIICGNHVENKEGTGHF